MKNVKVADKHYSCNYADESIHISSNCFLLITDFTSEEMYNVIPLVIFTYALIVEFETNVIHEKSKCRKIYQIFSLKC